VPGDAIDETDDRGRRIVGSTLFVMFNAGPDAVPVEFPDTPIEASWMRVFDTSDLPADAVTAYPSTEETVHA